MLYCMPLFSPAGVYNQSAADKMFVIGDMAGYMVGEPLFMSIFRSVYDRISKSG